MKKYSILFAAFLGLLYVTLSSNIDGAAHHGHGDVTGAATGTTGRCQTSSCHGGNSPSVTVQLQVLDSATMVPITTYQAGHTYLITLTGDATAVTTALPKFGFMVSATLGNHTLAGSYIIPTALSASIHTYPCGATTIVEHSTPLVADTTGVNKYSTYFYWTAPGLGSDSVSFYSLLNAVNGNGGSSGDHPNAAPKVTIYENASEMVKQIGTSKMNIVCFPNPAKNILNVSSATKITSVAIYNNTGTQVSVTEYNASTIQINVSILPAGTYFAKINNSEVRKFVKL